jgi:uncharacterized membrane protein YhaH (DUF805 family)
MNWYIGAIKKYVTFTGRARRMEYWMTTLINAVIVILLMILANAVAGGNPYALYSGNAFAVIYWIYAIFMFLPLLALTIRRLHDINKSWGWIFICLIPLAGGIWFLVLMCIKGTAGDNRFGPDPLGGILNPVAQ